MHFLQKYQRSFWNYAAEWDTETVPLFLPNQSVDLESGVATFSGEAFAVPKHTISLGTGSATFSMPAGTLSTVRAATEWAGKLSISSDGSDVKQKVSENYKGNVTTTGWSGKVDI
jgi:hypothetical protein